MNYSNLYKCPDKFKANSVACEGRSEGFETRVSLLPGLQVIYTGTVGFSRGSANQFVEDCDEQGSDSIGEAARGRVASVAITLWIIGRAG